VLILAVGWTIYSFSRLDSNYSGFHSQDDPAQALKILTQEGGLYRIPVDELKKVGFEGSQIEDASLRLTNYGHPQPFWIDEIDGIPVLSFYAQPGQSEYSAENVYILQTGGDLSGGFLPTPEPISQPLPVDALPSGTYYEITRAEENQLYLPQALGSQHWFWQPIAAGQKVELNLPVSQLTALGEVRAVLRVGLWGATEAPADPDHHLEVLINGQQAASDAWDGEGFHILEAEFDPGLLREGDNIVSLEAPGDTGVAAEVNYLDWIEIVYPRQLLAREDRLEFVTAGGEVELAGFTGPVRVYDISDPRAANRIEDLSTVNRNGSISEKLPTQSGRRYLAIGPKGYLNPTQIEPAVVSPDLGSMGIGADYIAIGPPDLLEPLRPLLDYRAAQGLQPLAVPLQAVYDQFGYGLPEPGAIQRFMQQAQTWKRAPRYLLLVGDASYDPKGYISSAEANRLPAFLVETVYGGQTASDVGFVQINDDPWPDLAVGRVPARTPQQVEAFVEKTLQYERQPREDANNMQVLAVADGQDPSFASYARLFLDSFHEGIRSQLISPSPGDSQASAQVIRSLSSGPLLAAYFGHGSLTMWGKDRLFTVEDVPKLENTGRFTVVLNLTCLTGFFTHPKTESLAEALLFQPGKGAVAVLAPSSLTLPGDQSFLTEPFVKELVNHPEYTLGELHLAARRLIPADQPGQRDVMQTFMLFGDPALRLPLR
jgi:hypothetical protein